MAQVGAIHGWLPNAMFMIPVLLLLAEAVAVEQSRHALVRRHEVDSLMQEEVLSPPEAEPTQDSLPYSSFAGEKDSKVHPDEKTEKEGKGGMSVEVSSAGEAHRPDTAFSPSVANGTASPRTVAQVPTQLAHGPVVTGPAPAPGAADVTAAGHVTLTAALKALDATQVTKAVAGQPQDAAEAPHAGAPGPASPGPASPAKTEAEADEMESSKQIEERPALLPQPVPPATAPSGGATAPASVPNGAVFQIPQAASATQLHSRPARLVTAAAAAAAAAAEQTALDVMGAAVRVTPENRSEESRWATSRMSIRSGPLKGISSEASLVEAQNTKLHQMPVMGGGLAVSTPVAAPMVAAAEPTTTAATTATTAATTVAATTAAATTAAATTVAATTEEELETTEEESEEKEEEAEEKEETESDESVGKAETSFIEQHYLLLVGAAIGLVTLVVIGAICCCRR
ncbi:unnamed protein product [Durusdinium trenchii]|uniref:Uncharacterized protein n=1 Tax=Durusdinium trenchii TaxID=1381693 RepID=A0ABP0QFP0_9DINO